MIITLKGLALSIALTS